MQGATKVKTEEEANLEKVYPISAIGSIKYRDITVALLHEVVFRNYPLNFSTWTDDNCPNDTYQHNVIHGFIIYGAFTLESTSKYYYGRKLFDDAHFKKTLTGQEIIELYVKGTRSNKPILIENLTFENPVIQGNNSLIQKVKFKGHVISE